MIEMEYALRDPATVAAEDLLFPEVPGPVFEGFAPEAFEILGRLRESPHIGCYRREKAAIRRHIIEPFHRYRDDLVVSFVFPNRLAFETEKGVFSRFLKNDFGAGGCHHHLWLSFYRPGRRRLTDFQIAHTIHADGFSVGFFAGERMGDRFREVRERILRDPEPFLGLLDPLLQIQTNHGSCNGADPDLPAILRRARYLRVRSTFPMEVVLDRGPALLTDALEVVRDLWPLYRYFAG